MHDDRPDPVIIANAARYGHNLKPLIDESTLTGIPPLYDQNKKHLTNAWRTWVDDQRKTGMNKSAGSYKQ